MSNPAMNKARCFFCNEIVTSRHLHDHAICKCGNVSVCGGLVNPIIRASDYSGVRGVEIGEDEVEAKEHRKEEEHCDEPEQKITREELFERFEARLATLLRLPSIARTSFISHDDLYSWMSDVLAILRTF